MAKIICLDQNYSTTRLLTQEKPKIVNSPEDKFQTILSLPEGEGRKGEGGLRTKGYFKQSYDDKPLISIITVVFNGERFLEDTIKSVINQKYDNVEYVIIDGASTDRTVDIIKKFESQIDYWVSEKDEGIYDAMNKGIKLTQGDLIGLINADDYYLLDTVSDIVSSISFKSADIVYGDMDLIAREGAEILQHRRASHKKLIYGMSLNHPATFVRRVLYTKEGFDTTYRLAADYDFLLRQKMCSATFRYIQKTLAIMRDDGASKALSILTSREERAIKKEYLSWMVFLLTEAAKRVSTFVKG